mmetsp:Transcript_16769/g.25508  ORF Transcript_16769/g.25508 Transcript_16769/m.25508 type:complete len:101 (+) Transcript_16769:688-990(+)
MNLALRDGLVNAHEDLERQIKTNIEAADADDITILNLLSLSSTLGIFSPPRRYGIHKYYLATATTTTSHVRSIHQTDKRLTTREGYEREGGNTPNEQASH